MNNNQFVESMRVKKVTISTELRSEIIAILKGEKTIKEVCNSHREDKDFPKDPKGIKRKMGILIEQDEEVRGLFTEYSKKANTRPRGYSYIPEMIDMLENDLSQRQLAEKYGLSRDTIKSAIDRVNDEQLKKLVARHSARHALGRNCPAITLEEERNILKYKQEYEQKQEEREQ